MSATPVLPDSQQSGAGVVAVIVVHGVADQEPGESARAIATMLASLNTPTEAKYSTFEEDDVRVDVEPLTSASGPTRTLYICAKQLAQTGAADATSCATDPGIAMIQDQLRSYKPSVEDSVYRTLRLQASLRGDARTQAVHIYEMYWADLSRLGNGLLRILGELYQLLLHVPSLGRHAVDAAGINDGRGNPAWDSLIEQQRWAAYFLTVPVPLLNLWMIGCLAVGLTGPLGLAHLPPQLRPVPAVAILGLTAIVGLATALGRSQLPYGAWGGVPLLVLTASIGLYGWMISSHQEAFKLTAFVALGFVTLGAQWILQQYSRTQPFAKRFGTVSLWMTAIVLAIELVRAANSSEGVLTAAFHVVEVLYVAAAIAWGFFFLVFFATLVTGSSAIRAARSDTHPATQAIVDRLERTTRTARLTLALPAVSFIVITMALWTGLYAALEVAVSTTGYTPWPPLAQLGLAKGVPHSEAALKLLVNTTPEMNVVLGMIGLALLLALWATLPPIMSEIRPPQSDTNPGPLGDWLSRGFRLLRASGSLIIAACGIVMPIVALSLLASTTIGRVLIGETTNTTVKWLLAVIQSTNVLLAMGTMVSGAAAGIFVLSGRLKKLTGGLRPVLDVLLDVDNYLREHPVDNNPRARIFARYVALLRHVCEWRDDQGRMYDAVVIMSHSQGTVISADLLRYLRCHPEPSLAALAHDIPIKLLTMGCPLRQLYGLRFPHLYEWARHLDTTGQAAFPDNRVPVLKPLGVASWTNLYRSGDYVGRFLWREDADSSAFALSDAKGVSPVVFADSIKSRDEWCIGAGGHTHYWEPSATLVINALDNSVRQKA